MRVACLLLAAGLLFLSVVSAHDVWATPTAVCIDDPVLGYGPYISWCLENDYFLRATMILSVATSLGPAGTSINFDVYGSPGGKICNILQAFPATAIRASSVVWTDNARLAPWSKASTVTAPVGCTPCVLANNGTLCGSQTGIDICMARKCVNNACVPTAISVDTRCPSKQGVADGLPLCTQQKCLDGDCVTNQPYADPACDTTAMPTGVEPACNLRACVGTACITAPWFYPATTPTSAPACTALGDHDAQCWRPACVLDTTLNAPYGQGVCGGTAVDISPLTCPPPKAPNNQPVNPACYVAQCVPATGLCSTTFLAGLGGTDPSQHVGNCPVPEEYDVECYWPYCDANGQCSGDILTGEETPYLPGWRVGTSCPVPPEFDQQCFKPACVEGKCGGFPVTGSINLPSIQNGVCELPPGVDKQCFVAACIAGKCSGFPITGNSTHPGMLPGTTCPVPEGFDPECYIASCIGGHCEGFPITGNSTHPGMLPGTVCPVPEGFDAECYVAGCVEGQCQGFPITGTIDSPGAINGVCELPDGYDPQCFVPACIEGLCQGFPITGNSTHPGVLPGTVCPVPEGYDPQCYIPGCVEGQCLGFPKTGNADEPGYTGPEGCPMDPAMNPQCWTPFCVDGKCSGHAIAGGLPCVPSPSEIVDGYTEDCVVYHCGSDVTSAGSCVPTLLPMDNACNSSGVTPNGCSENKCINGTCTSQPINIGKPCPGDGNPLSCNEYVCVLDGDAGVCAPQPLLDVPCSTDLDLCTTQACVLDPVTNLGACVIVENVTCDSDLAKPCDPAVCDPATGTCINIPAPDYTACVADDPTCGDYSCYHGECIRNCLCGNGMLDGDESCDWGADLWCPAPVQGGVAPSDLCEGVEPGNMGLGNGLGRNESFDFCNMTTCRMAKPEDTGLSKGAIAGIAVAGAAGVAAVALAGALAWRAAASAGAAPGSAAASGSAAADSFNNPLFMGGSELSNPLFSQ